MIPAATPPPYPVWTCHECGDAYGRGMPEGHVYTWHIGICGVCAEETLRKYAQVCSQLERAEGILCDLAHRDWQGILAMAGPPLTPEEPTMGERILDYWRNVEKTEPDFQHGSEALIDPAREKFFQQMRRHYGQPLPKEPPVSSKP